MDSSRDRAPDLRTVDVLFLSLAVLTCAMRCYTRLFVVRAFGADDWLMMVATTFYVFYVMSGFISTAHGSGRPKDTLSEHDLSVVMKHWFLCYVWYDVAMICARVSIGIFFLRLTVKRFHLYLIYLVMVTTVVFGIVFMGVAIGECTPAAYFWDKGIDGGRCMNAKILVALMYLYSTSSLASDVAFAVFPMFLMRGLQMDRRTKYALVPILGLGWIASIAVLIRLAFLTALASDNFPYEAMPIAILSSAEQGLAITAGNLATLRPLFTRKLKFWGSYIGKSDGGVGHYLPNIGAQDRAKGRDGSGASVGLATFMREETGDEERRASASEPAKTMSKQQGIAVRTDIAITSQKRSSIWCASRQDRNESQEELYSQPSRETLDSNTKIVPASFLAKHGGLRDSTGT